MSNTIKHFIKTIEANNEQIFVAHTDNDLIRVGYKGGFIIEGNNKIVTALATEIVACNDFDTASDILDTYHITYWAA